MTPKFGTMLRALRLGWYYWQEEGVYVRITPRINIPECDNFYVETARTFKALTEGTIEGTAFHYIVDEEHRNTLVESCEPLQRRMFKDERDYHCWLVNDNGRIIL